MPKIHLIEGPVGAGKSTYSRALQEQGCGVHIALDAWFATLFSPDRPSTDLIPWYVERKERLIQVIWQHSERLLAAGSDVILELGLIQRDQRIPFCRMARDAGHDVLIHVLDAPIEVRRQRVHHRNTERGPTFASVVPDHVFELASQLWEPPDEVECDEFAIQFVAHSGCSSEG